MGTTMRSSRGLTKRHAPSHRNRCLITLKTRRKGGKHRQAASDPFAPIPVEARNAENTTILDGNEDPEAPIREAKRAREQKKTAKNDKNHNTK